MNPHARDINKLPSETRAIVLDALRVRAMDFVGDRLASDGGDEAADIYRDLAGEDEYTFDPEHYATSPTAR